MYPILTWQELAILIPKLNGELVGARLERVRVPLRAFAKNGYLRSEWMFDLRAGKTQKALILSLDGLRCGLHLAPSHPPMKPALNAPNHSLDLHLRKELEGLPLLKMEALGGERWVLLSFGNKTDPVDLWVSLIPAKRNAVLMRVGSIIHTFAALPTPFPPESRVGPELAVRETLVQSAETHGNQCEVGIRESEFTVRRNFLLGRLSQEATSLKKRIASLEVPKQKNVNPDDDSRFGHLLQGWLYTGPLIVERTGKKYFVCGEDFVPVHESWGDARAHLKRYFDRAKKAARGEMEHLEKRTLWNESLKRIEEKIVALAAIGSLDYQALAPFERAPKSSVGAEQATQAGRMSLSLEGFLIQTGRNSAENLEITLKVARGNDLWFHVKGRPSAHTIIRLPPGKSASLETLILAARLTLFYSGGRGWGKTEVDYTFRKHVKRIPGSTEVQYSQNKTLVVDCPEDFKPPEGSV